MDIDPGYIGVIPTGIAIAIPEGIEAQIRPRSGLTRKYNVTVANSPGTIDSDYRGEIKVLLKNHGKGIFHVEVGGRIAQLVFNKVELPAFTVVDELPLSDRGEGGFGSTGTD